MRAIAAWSLVLIQFLVAACGSGGATAPTAPVESVSVGTPGFGVHIDPATPAVGEDFTVTVSGLAPDEVVALKAVGFGTQMFARSIAGDGSGQARYRTRLTGDLPAVITVTATRSSGAIAGTELRLIGATAVAPPTAQVPTAAATAPPTLAPTPPPTQAPVAAPVPTDPHDTSQICPAPRAFMTKPTYHVGELAVATICLPAAAATIALYLAIAPDRSQLPSWGEAHVIKHGVSFMETAEIAKIPPGIGTWQIRYLADGVAYYLSYIVVP